MYLFQSVLNPIEFIHNLECYICKPDVCTVNGWNMSVRQFIDAMFSPDREWWGGGLINYELMQEVMTACPYLMHINDSNDSVSSNKLLKLLLCTPISLCFHVYIVAKTVFSIFMFHSCFTIIRDEAQIRLTEQLNFRTQYKKKL